MEEGAGISPSGGLPAAGTAHEGAAPEGGHNAPPRKAKVKTPAQKHRLEAAYASACCSFAQCDPRRIAAEPVHVHELLQERHPVLLEA